MGERSGVRAYGLVCCFYRLANPTTLAMQWEAIGMNADFWSQVLQSRSLKPLDFALGAVMAIRRQHLEEIGGFAPLVDCLADDYQLGNRIARRGHPIILSSLVVECWSAPMGWAAVWKHQLRWARTIRVCQPVPRSEERRVGSDWSSDVCSSDLDHPFVLGRGMLVSADGMGRRLEASAPLGAHDSRVPTRALLLQPPEQCDPLASPLD